MLISLASILLVSSASCAAAAAPSSPAFPVVDLGYARHAPTSINTTKTNITYATYRNIRFAQPPVGNLRFRRPVTPPPASSGIQDGVVPLNSTNCIQTVPHWLAPTPGLNGSTWGSEDCLFLDVYVPGGVSMASAATGLPVMHWIYGGGYFFGAKDTGNDPSSLFEEMGVDEKFIVVASNYRLGPIGWLSSDTEQSLDRNAGLYDVLEGLRWTQEYIYRFGGDPDKVTAMGQSAGGGNLFQILGADAQGTPAPFSQAFVSSPGYRPHVNRSQEMTAIYRQFLNATSCDDADCLRKVPTERLVEANRYMILDAPPGPFGGPSIGFGPIIDGDLVQDAPERILSQAAENGGPKGRVTRIIGGGMKNDGIGNVNTTWEAMLAQFARTPSNATVQRIASLYGQPSNSAAGTLPGGVPAPTVFDKFYGDIIYECHSHLAARLWSAATQKEHSSPCAPPQKRYASYRYDQSILPALHGGDLNYYFFDAAIAALDKTVVPDVAREFQHHVRQFILGRDLDGWPEFGGTGLQTPSWMNVTSEGFRAVVGKDESVRAKRCEAIVELLSNTEDGW
ncbi:esterase [Akanthomyces lecanii RCEF 1005]|uniref:Esterase n=1 Tax=Akanthomyces lecanii RCEF 1005 TaxID=1081108 RepID=A0A162KNE2_CORDF|nr:esterase [Akanthomyces lecanii RCEF 1005]